MSHEYDITKLSRVSTARSAIQLDQNGAAEATLAISVATTGAYTITNPDGSSFATFLAAGVLHWISTKTALGTPAGVVTYWY